MAFLAKAAERGHGKNIGFDIESTKFSLLGKHFSKNIDRNRADRFSRPGGEACCHSDGIEKENPLKIQGLE